MSEKTKEPRRVLLSDCCNAEVKMVDPIAWDGVCPKCGKSTLTHQSIIFPESHTPEDKQGSWENRFDEQFKGITHVRCIGTHKCRTMANNVKYFIRQTVADEVERAYNRGYQKGLDDMQHGNVVPKEEEQNFYKLTRGKDFTGNPPAA